MIMNMRPMRIDNEKAYGHCGQKKAGVSCHTSSFWLIPKQWLRTKTRYLFRISKVLTDYSLQSDMRDIAKAYIRRL